MNQIILERKWYALVSMISSLIMQNICASKYKIKLILYLTFRTCYYRERCKNKPEIKCVDCGELKQLRSNKMCR